ncbi:MAG: type II toxin-antitoxin system RelE/ParE family toxin, partial [Holdemanella biformis]|uniref:type II toxin-antitoxin system RelE/ParE family toxin n=1 Tax=Holdemanella biformis TaxID=1735 RepID=UPI002430082A
LVEDKMFLRFFSLYIQSHSLATSLHKAMELCKKKEKMIHTFVQLLTYPFTLILTLLLFSFFAIAFVEPRLEKLYASFQVKTSLLQKLTLNTIALLKDNPYLGPKMSDRFNVDTPLRYFVISKQLVFYNIKNDNIEIIRILDSRQDYLSLLL